MTESKWETVIETDLSDEEREEFRQSEIEYRENPESFVSMTEFLKQRPIRADL
ncbi:MAG: hypothetical protein LBL87_03705 [Ruminococcus sp.]|jgi:hypothetical protein|nr:hypothetical protein [Ruminococcus sp.]